MTITNGHSLPTGNVKKSPGRPPKLDLERLKQLHDSGADDAEIAAELGVVRSTVVKARQRLGLVANRPRGRQRNWNGLLVVTKDEIFQQHVQAVRELSGPQYRVRSEDWLSWSRSAYCPRGVGYVCSLPSEVKPADMPKKIQPILLVLE
ncbi:MAG: hypothetical protein IMW96_11445 [Thermoanaerobacteraceae bacterium]|nr:hypothetical protein [Thermoanaerobacteraceae bacterium]